MLRYCARAHDTWEVSVSIGYEDSKRDGYVWLCRLSQLVELSAVLSSDSVFVIRFAWSVNKSFVICWKLLTTIFSATNQRSSFQINVTAIWMKDEYGLR